MALLLPGSSLCIGKLPPTIQKGTFSSLPCKIQVKFSFSKCTSDVYTSLEFSGGLDAAAASQCGSDVYDMGSDMNLAKEQSHTGLSLVWSGVRGTEPTSVVQYQSNEVAQGRFVR